MRYFVRVYAVRAEYVSSPEDGAATLLVHAFELPRNVSAAVPVDQLEVGSQVTVPLELLAPLGDQQAAFEERVRLRTAAVELVESFRYGIHDEAIALTDALDAAGARDYAQWLRATTTLRRVWRSARVL